VTNFLLKVNGSPLFVDVARQALARLNESSANFF
jgi:hypothetical protein